MRHRIGGIGTDFSTGLGNSDKAILDNKGNINKEFADEAINLYFKLWGGCDYSVIEDRIDLGNEPAYRYEPLKIISINKNINKSYIKTGIAWGDYGSNIISKTKYYSEYKNKSKFVKFISKWHRVLFPEEYKEVNNLINSLAVGPIPYSPISKG